MLWKIYTVLLSRKWEGREPSCICCSRLPSNQNNNYVKLVYLGVVCVVPLQKTPKGQESPNHTILMRWLPKLGVWVFLVSSCLWVNLDFPGGSQNCVHSVF